MAEITIDEIRKVFREELSNLENDRLINAKDACDFIGICFPTLQKWVETGRVKTYTIGAGTVRYKKADLLKAAENKYQRVQTLN